MTFTINTLSIILIIAALFATYASGFAGGYFRYYKPKSISAELKEGERFCVIVDNLYVHVTKTDEGVVVDVYGEDQIEVIATTYAYFSEGIPDATNETVVILWIANGFVKHSGGAIANISHFPNAKVGQTWEIEVVHHKIKSTRLVSE